MADPSGQIGSSLNNPMQIIGQGVQPPQQPGGQPWMKEYTQPQGGWGAPFGGGSGQFGGGGGGAFKSGGYGQMSQFSGPYAEALMASAPSLNWGSGIGGDIPNMMQGHAKAEADAAAKSHGWEMEQQQREQFSQQQQMGNLRMQAMQKLLSLFGGQGGQGGMGGGMGAGAPMPIQMDPQMLASMKASTEAAYEPVQRQLAASRAQRGTGIGDSSAATAQAGMLQGRMARDIQAGYMPAMNASVAAYQPGVTTRGQDMQSQGWLPQLLMRLFGG